MTRPPGRRGRAGRSPGRGGKRVRVKGGGGKKGACDLAVLGPASVLFVGLPLAIALLAAGCGGPRNNPRPHRTDPPNAALAVPSSDGPRGYLTDG